MSTEIKGKRIDETNIRNLEFRDWRHTKLPYPQLTEALKAGIPYFVEGIKRQTAHGAAERLSKKLGFKVVAIRSRLEGDQGYSFFKEGLENFFEKGKKEGWLKETTKQKPKR